MSVKFDDFQSILNEMKGDFEKFFDKENNAAGTRVRKHLQALAVLCKDGRKSVTEIKVARKEAKS